MRGLCLDYARIMCMMHGSFMDDDWIMLGRCLTIVDYAWLMLRLCLDYAWTMLGLHLNYAWIMLGLCLYHADYVWIMLGVCALCLDYPRIWLGCLDYVDYA